MFSIPAVKERETELKADALEAMMEREGIELGEVEILEGYDMNGPLTRTDDSDLPVHGSVAETFDELDVGENNFAALVSGHPIQNLEYFRDHQLEQEELGMVGELGSVMVNGGVEMVHPDIEPRELYEIHRDLYEKAAEENVKLLPQNNISNVASCIRVEGEGSPGDERSGLYKREEVVEQSIDEIAEALEPYDRFDYDGERILFNNSTTNAAVLTDVLREEFEYPGVRFEEAEDGRIAFYRDRSDRSDYSLEDAHEFVVEEVPDEYDHFVNDDWGVDIVTSEDVSKEEGARALAEAYFGEDDYVITHVGDKESDIMTSYDTFMLPQEGTEAHDYCLENRIPHVAVEDGAEYAEVLAELEGRR
ncbi:MAG: hypothetical protein ABEJ98_00235 [Candidatus Nanohaloarchaea archaeon]